ncbi:MAG: alpha/beta fold hydrolase [Steroidobacteraceae bacterium]
MTYSPRRIPRTEWLEIRGLRHRILRWGPVSEDPLILLHGWADTADTFQFLADAFAEDWPLLALDWRGFGQTAWAPDGYWFPDYLADLDTLLDRVCATGPARLVGHSMGGHVAMLYAGIQPDRVRRLVSLEGFGLPPSSPEESPERFARWLRQLKEPNPFGQFRDHGHFAHFLAGRNPRLGAERASFIARAWAAPSDSGGVVMRADPAHKRVNPYRYQREDAKACWARIKAPALLVLASESEYLGHLGEEGTGEGLATAMPGVRQQVIKGVGHMLHHEDPARVAAVVEGFLMEDIVQSPAQR